MIRSAPGSARRRLDRHPDWSKGTTPPRVIRARRVKAAGPRPPARALERTQCVMRASAEQTSRNGVFLRPSRCRGGWHALRGNLRKARGRPCSSGACPGTRRFAAARTRIAAGGRDSHLGNHGRPAISQNPLPRCDFHGADGTPLKPCSSPSMDLPRGSTSNRGQCSHAASTRVQVSSGGDPVRRRIRRHLFLLDPGARDLERGGVERPGVRSDRGPPDVRGAARAQSGSWIRTLRLFDKDRRRALGTVEVSLRLRDVQGRLIRNLAHTRQGISQYSVKWNADDDHGRHVAPGIYYLQLSAGSRQHTVRVANVN